MTKSTVDRTNWIALLGRRDTPVDGVEDYCTFLGRALGVRGIELNIVRVPWVEKGWIGALRHVRRECEAWAGRWLIVQYTGLAWSRRGFPLLILAVVATLRRRRVRVAVVFHEPKRQGGSRWIDRLRGSHQDWVIRHLYRLSERAIFTVPLNTVSWLPDDKEKAAFIPIGASVAQWSPESKPPLQQAAIGTVVVFCLDAMPALRQELRDISEAAHVAAKSGARFRVVFVGRGTHEAAAEITSVFGHIPVEISILGLLSPDELTDALSGAEVMLCVRGRVNQCRSSAIAGLACGLPIVAYAGEVQGTPMENAGLALVPFRDTDALGAALFRILTDSNLSRELRERSYRTYQKNFSWDSIAATYAGFLEGANN